MVPSYSGRDTFWPLCGSVHSLVPLVRPMKFFTVLGPWVGKNSHLRSPAEVWKMAVGAALAAVALSALFALLWAGLFDLVCAAAARPKHSRINAARLTIHLSLLVRNRILEMESCKK